VHAAITFASASAPAFGRQHAQSRKTLTLSSCVLVLKPLLISSSTFWIESSAWSSCAHIRSVQESTHKASLPPATAAFQEQIGRSPRVRRLFIGAALFGGARAQSDALADSEAEE
jgi:hypothetical protein